MTISAKKGFADFVRPSPDMTPDTSHPQPLEASIAAGTTQEVASERIRQVSSTGRVRTYSANRLLPGVTLRLTEERWERLKTLSMQERRPIQEILGEAAEAYMKSRGLPW